MESIERNTYANFMGANNLFIGNVGYEEARYRELPRSHVLSQIQLYSSTTMPAPTRPASDRD